MSLSQLDSSYDAAFGGGRGTYLMTKIWIDDACEFFGNPRLMNAG